MRTKKYLDYIKAVALGKTNKTLEEYLNPSLAEKKRFKDYLRTRKENAKANLFLARRQNEQRTKR